MKFLSFWKPILVALIIFYGSLTSSDNINSFSIFNFENSDKIIHFTFYLILSLTLLASLNRNLINRNKQIILTVLLVISYGILLEVLQYFFTDSRTGDYFDALANSLGCMLGIISFPFLLKYKISKFL